MCEFKRSEEGMNFFMFKEISVIGGDLRNVKLIESLAKDGVKLYTYGFNNIFENKNNIMELDTIEKCLEKSDYVISAIPLSKDGIYLNSPYIKEKVDLREVIYKMTNKIFVAGVIDKKIVEILEKQNNKIVDLMNNEVLTIYNAIATVEGAIAKMIMNTDITLYKSNILILGYGRIGKILSNRLSNFGANIFCEARKEKDIAWINTDGYIPVELEKLEEFIRQNKIDIIINTIPYLILNNKVLDLLNKNVYILDLASKPGGVDLEHAKKLNLNVEWYLGVPGKIAPFSVAEFIKDVLI